MRPGEAIIQRPFPLERSDASCLDAGTMIPRVALKRVPMGWRTLLAAAIAMVACWPVAGAGPGVPRPWLTGPAEIPDVITIDGGYYSF